MYYPISSENVIRTRETGGIINWTIQTMPGRTNMSHEERTSGWLGTTNDVSHSALGAFETYEEAVSAIREQVSEGFDLFPADDYNDLPMEFEERRVVTSDCNESLFSSYQIKDCPLYAPLMDELNDLYQEHGCPAMQYPGQPSTTTGGPYNDLYWESHEIGDWNGREDDVACEQRRQIDVVISALGLSYPYYYTTPEWNSFVSEAEERLRDYERSGAPYEAAMDLDLLDDSDEEEELLEEE